MKKILINIYYYQEGGHYGLNIIFEFTENYLLFDSSKFYFINKLELDISNWKKIKYDKTEDNIYIKELREDEIVSFFIIFSNRDIFYIYQRIDGLENWEQNFDIITIDNELKYKEIVEYMNEDWIEILPFPPDNYSLSK
jgi:hypothetical protein